jgi:hypothetical protein
VASVLSLNASFLQYGSAKKVITSLHSLDRIANRLGEMVDGQ